MRRDRILQSAVTAAIAMVPSMVRADYTRTTPSIYSEDTTQLRVTDVGSVFGGAVSPLVGSATWVSPFFTNNTSLAGSWNNAANWSPAVVPGGAAGNVATFGPVGNGDAVGAIVFDDIANN